MKGTKNEKVITGMMVVKAAMMVALVATVILVVYGILTGDGRLLGEASMLACVQTGFWSGTAIKEGKEKKVKKNEIVD